ncbi:MAG: DMT family transporter [Ruminococcus sp.]|nr:DMT family transporter [Ruminococcus sp.]
MTVKKKYLGIIYIIISAFCFAFMSAFVRLSGDLPTMQKAFFRNFVALWFALAVLIKNKTPIRVEGTKPKIALFVRCLAGSLGLIGNFYAVDRLKLSDASMLNKMSPFFAVVFAIIVVKEKLSMVQLITVLGAFAGSLFIIKPSFSNADLLPALAGFGGGMGAGLAYACVRYMGKHNVNGPLIVAFFSVFSCMLTLPFMILNFTPMSLKQLLFLLGAGMSAAGGQFSITAAYSHAPPREISVYDYSQLIFSTCIGFFLFGDVPDVWSFVGYFIIVGMAVLQFFYNNVWHKEND